MLCCLPRQLSQLSTPTSSKTLLTPLPSPAARSYLVIKRPWPSMMRTVAGDHHRFEQTYFSHYKVGLGFSGLWLGRGP